MADPKISPLTGRTNHESDQTRSGQSDSRCETPIIVGIKPTAHKPPPRAPMSDISSHYENFPVASWLCPRHLRAPIAAIYVFARTADDIADEGNAPAQQRLDDLHAFGTDLTAASLARPHSGRWPLVFEPLGRMIRQFQLPVAQLADLLDAFAQDVAKTRDGAGYETHDELLDYCRRSANPVGRLLLHLYGVSDEVSRQHSDNICTALQLINFWQDLGTDIRNGRYYLPHQDCVAYGVSQSELIDRRQTPNVSSLIAHQVHLARATMRNGSQLAKNVPGRAGWELRMVVQGGLRILDKIETLKFTTLVTRPKISIWDMPVMLLRALRM